MLQENGFESSVIVMLSEGFGFASKSLSVTIDPDTEADKEFVLPAASVTRPEVAETIGAPPPSETPPELVLSGFARTKGSLDDWSPAPVWAFSGTLFAPLLLLVPVCDVELFVEPVVDPDEPLAAEDPVPEVDPDPADELPPDPDVEPPLPVADPELPEDEPDVDPVFPEPLPWDPPASPLPVLPPVCDPPSPPPAEAV